VYYLKAVLTKNVTHLISTSGTRCLGAMIFHDVRSIYFGECYVLVSFNNYYDRLRVSRVPGTKSDFTANWCASSQQ